MGLRGWAKVETRYFDWVHGVANVEGDQRVCRLLRLNPVMPRENGNARAYTPAEIINVARVGVCTVDSGQRKEAARRRFDEHGLPVVEQQRVVGRRGTAGRERRFRKRNRLE